MEDYNMSLPKKIITSVMGSELRQALLFEVVSESVFRVALVDSKTQESQRRRNGLS